MATKVRFTANAEVNGGGGSKNPKEVLFKAGDEVDFAELYGEEPTPAGMDEAEAEKNRGVRAEASAARWVNRGVAEYVRDEDGGKPKARKGVKPAAAKDDGANGEEPKGDDKDEAGKDDKPPAAPPPPPPPPPAKPNVGPAPKKPGEK